MDANNNIEITDSDSRLRLCLEKYRNTKFQISDKQIALIELLIKNISPSSDDSLKYITETKLLDRIISTWSELSMTDVGILISKLKNRQPISKAQITKIKSRFTIEEINKILIINLTSYSELNYRQTKTLLNSNSKFKMQCKDHPILNKINYEHGWQESSLCENNKMTYLKFYDLMMVDYDKLSYEEVIKLLEPYSTTYLFKIYQTFNGYHVFIVSKLINHTSVEAVQLMTNLKCDYFYILFCYKNGYKIRLSKKINRNEPFISRFIGFFGDANLLNSDCQKLIDILDSY